MQNDCPVCETGLNKMPESDGMRAVVYYSCPQCGDFVLSVVLLKILPKMIRENPEGRLKISHAIRSMQKSKKTPEIYSDTIEELLKHPFPSPKEQADLLIRWVAENVAGPGEKVEVKPATHSAILGATTPEGFAFVLDYLFSKNLLTGKLKNSLSDPGWGHVTPSFEGWDYYESLQRGESTYRKAFMAMKYDDPELENVVNEIFRSATLEAGFELIRLDERPLAGLIDDHLRVQIQSSDFLIADLTHDNLGAYWEAGYAEGLGKPVIYTCKREKFEEDRTHFDTNHHLTILWEKEKLEAAGEKLKATIRATLPKVAKQQDD